jgi:Mg2+ and Co2+ transporter CorA
MSILTWVATIALPITVIAGIFGMNNHAFTGDENGELKAWYNHFDSQFLIIIGITGLICLIIYLLLKRNGRR